MAGDWIKMRSNLRRHPKIVRIASALNADRLRVLGGLHAVWCLFDEHSVDGQLYGYTRSALDEEIGFPGFADALIGIGWLSSDGNDGLSLPDFDAHNGASAKRRAQEADRKRAERATGNDDPQGGEIPSASGADKKRTREEKRREERREKKPSVSSARGSRLPTDWEPGETGDAFAEQQGLRNGRAAAELARFRDYWSAQPGQKGVKADWQATWRNWVRKAAESPQGHAKPFQTAKERDTANAAAWFNESTGGLLGREFPPDDVIEMETPHAAQIGNR